MLWNHLSWLYSEFTGHNHRQVSVCLEQKRNNNSGASFFNFFLKELSAI